MADFSKQYCEKYGMGFEGDFDIDEEFDSLLNDHWRPIICEGYGFWGIKKDKEGNKFCIFGADYRTDIPYSEITDQTYKKYS